MPELMDMLNRAFGIESRQVPKTGLASRMREWMSRQKRPFTVADICAALDVPQGKEHARVQNAIPDFINRGEVIPVTKRNRRQLFYNQGWYRLNKGMKNKRIYKAMRVISFKESFTVADIQKATALPDRDWIEKIVTRLVKNGYLRVDEIRNRPQGGRERRYRVVDPDRFHLELILTGENPPVSPFPKGGDKREGKL